MKLEITHLAPYLPYGLKWKFDGEDFTHDIVGLDITNRGVKLVSPYNDYGDCEISSGKPLLLPMSSLYTEMEDGTVPIDEFFLIYGGEVCDAAKNYWKTNFAENIIYSSIESLNFGVVSKLIEWHFDVFGLIDKGLAIDKTKIKAKGK